MDESIYRLEAAVSFCNSWLLTPLKSRSQELQALEEANGF